jgi:tetratricopeptide (TPR) repeat protein
MGAGRVLACGVAGLVALLAAGLAVASPTPIGPPVPAAPVTVPGLLAAPTPPQPGVTSALTQDQFRKLPPNQQAAVRELLAISGELQAANFTDALPRLMALTQTPDFLALPPIFTHAGFSALVALDLRAGRLDDAEAAVRVATASPAANASDWGQALTVALTRRDSRETIVDLTTLVTKYPDSAKRMSDAGILSIYATGAPGPEGDDLRYALAQALIAADWRPQTPFVDDSGLLIDHVAAMLDRGDLADARGLIGQVDEPAVMVAARADKRFAPLVAINPGAFDLTALRTRRLAALDTAIAANPGLAAGVAAKATTLIVFGDYTHALSLLDDALAKAQPADGEPSAYVDAQGALPVLMGLRAQALAGLGRYDEALRQLARAADRPENGRINVTQRLALARLDIAMGKPADALATLGALDPSDTSPAGRLVVEGLTACAADRTGDTKTRDAALTFVRTHLVLAPGDTLQAWLCLGDADQAAQLLIAMLDSPHGRLTALGWAQTLKRPPAPAPNADDDARRAALLARPDVQAAIAKVGAINPAPLYRLDF